MTKEDITRAEKIIDTWFWQIDETRAYGYRGALNTITRFYESAPMSADIMRIVLEYLNSQEKMTKVSLNNKLVELDGEWKAVAAFYRTAQGQNWAGTESSKVRVYQMLVRMGEEEGDGPYVVEDGCKYKVTHTFHWNTAEEPTLPKSTSGVQYQISGLNRDKETGLYSYVIECRETVQQDVELYDTAITSFEKRQEELHLGVKADSVDSTGKAASVNNGVITERRITKNPDCTSDVQNVVITEQPKSNVVIVKRKSVRGVTTSVTNRNQPSADANGEPTQIGESLRSEMTDGGLYNNTHETFKATPQSDLGSRDDNTVFESASETTKAQDTAPSGDIASAGGGKYHSRTVRANDEGGYDVTNRTTEEKEQTSAVVVKRKTLNGLIVSTTDRNQSSAKTIDNPSEIGETFRSEMTPGGLYNNTHETFDINQEETLIDESIVEDEFKQDYSRTHNKPDFKGVDREEAEYFRKGVITQERYSRTEYGTTNESVREIKAKESWHEFDWEDARGSYHKVVYRNQPESKVKDTIPSTALSSEANETINEFGLYDGTLIWKTEDKEDDGETETLMWEESNVPVSSKYYYVNASGELCTRTFSGLVDYCCGRTDAVIQRVAAGEQVSAVGWSSGWTGNHEFAHGRCYHDIEVSAEESVDGSSEGDE